MEEEVTLVRLSLDGKKLFVRTEWRGNSFILEATDGAHAWVCDVSPEEAEERASSWVVSGVEFVADARRYLSQQVKDSEYDFVHGPRDGQKKLSWSTKRGGVEVFVRWVLHPAKKQGEVILRILEMLADENEELKDTVERKTRALERMNVEARKALDQSDRFQAEKNQIQDDLYKKFVAVLNAKKEKIRQLKQAAESGYGGRKELLALEDGYHSPQEEEEEEEDSEPHERGASSEQNNGGKSTNQEDISDTANKGKAPMAESVEARDEAGPSGEGEGGRALVRGRVKQEEEDDTKPDVREVERTGGGILREGAGGGGRGASAKQAVSLLGGEAYASAPRKRRR